MSGLQWALTLASVCRALTPYFTGQPGAKGFLAEGQTTHYTSFDCRREHFGIFPQ